MQRDDLSDTTRRAVLKATAGALGVAATGTASAHEWGSSSTTTAVEGSDAGGDDVPGGHGDARPVGYHALGSAGPATDNPDTESRNPHYGAMTEIRTHGDYAYVGFFSSDSPTPGRGMAILDISDYNSATSDADLDSANLSVVSFLRNNSTGTAVMDLKVSDDGDYVFLGTQPYTALFPSPTADPVAAASKSEAGDPTPNTADDSDTIVPGAVVAVDVSDKANPETVGAIQISGTGVHNLFHHRIGGDEYVFAVHDLNDGTEGMYVLRFDRSSGQLELVNRWSLSGDTRQGELNPDMLYIHDVEVQDDPITGRPTAYLGYWGAGLQVLDVSNPEDIVLKAHFDMNGTGRCHFTSPAPELVETSQGTKRLAVASHETPDDSADADGTGNVYLVDASGIYEEDAEAGLAIDTEGTNDAGVPELRAIGNWEWQKKQSAGGENEISFGNFELSPHNSDVVVDDAGDVWVHQAHYHGGVRFLRLVDEDEGFSLEEQGFSRPKYSTPEESRMEGLSSVVPNCWAAVESNGITFASDINQGVHAIKADDISVGGAPPTADVGVSDDGSLFTAGQTDMVDLSVFPGRYDSLYVRDRLPTSWGVVGGDDHSTYEAGGSLFVEAADTAGIGDGFTYFAEAPASSGSFTFGPVEVSPDGETWHAVPGTIRSNVVLGQSTSLGTAAGAAGIAAHQRDRIVDSVGDVLGRDE
ncbi:LVIVD repeat-containing protein [Halorarius litoreus]|uniref:LVIVD repeat-containing protein n=1 Tax=Halorarius litoreus TaxID=2962676 RepID=UPI0020CBE2A5|nr:hypothetical protein [Halorarius litoreus]